MDKPELETLDYKPEKCDRGCCNGANIEQPKNAHLYDNCPDQPNSNAMIFEQVNGSIKVAFELLGQLKPKTDHVDGCIITLKSWQNNNLKHLQKAFE